MNEDNKFTVETSSNELPETTVNADEASDLMRVKHNPLSPKWWPSKDGAEPEPLADNSATLIASPADNEEIVVPVMVAEPNVEETITSPPPSVIITEAVQETIALISAPSAEKSVVAAEDGQILKTMSNVAAKAIEKSKSSLAKLAQLGSLKDSTPVIPTISAEVAAPVLRESFVTTEEKESRLKSIREAAAQKIERNRALRAQQISMTTPEIALTPAITSVAQSVATTPEMVVPVVTEMPLASPEEIAPAILDVLVPPPPRPINISSQNKIEMRSAVQTRINEAYLKQLKGEPPLIDDEPTPSFATDNHPPADGLRKIPVESLGTGIFNALGDMVAGAVNLAHVLGDNAQKVVTKTNPAPQGSGTARMVQGTQEMVTGVKDIVKGGGNIVIGAITMVTTPVIAVLNSIKSINKSESTET